MSPIGGYIRVPKNCTLSFYSDNLKTLSLAFIYHALLQRGDDLCGGKATQTINEYRTCPDYILSPMNEEQIGMASKASTWGRLEVNDTICRHKLFTLRANSKAQKLSNIIKAFEEKLGKSTIEGYNFHWLACRYFPLKTLQGNAPTINLRAPERELNRDDLEDILIWVS